MKAVAVVAGMRLAGCIEEPAAVADILPAEEGIGCGEGLVSDLGGLVLGGPVLGGSLHDLHGDLDGCTGDAPEAAAAIEERWRWDEECSRASRRHTDSCQCVEEWA